MRQSGKFDFSITKQGGIRLDFSVYSPTEWKTKIHSHLIKNSVKSIYYIIDVLLLLAQCGKVH